jgi:hypothetical protein
LALKVYATPSRVRRSCARERLQIQRHMIGVHRLDWGPATLQYWRHRIRRTGARHAQIVQTLPRRRRPARLAQLQRLCKNAFGALALNRIQVALALAQQARVAVEGPPAPGLHERRKVATIGQLELWRDVW